MKDIILDIKKTNIRNIQVKAASLDFKTYLAGYG